MNLITLNVWGGLLFKPLMEFLKQQSLYADIFCFQEVFDTTSKRQVSHGARVNIRQEIMQALPEFNCFYLPAEQGLDYEGPVNFDISWGLAIFVKRTIQITDSGFVNVYQGKEIVKGSHHSAMPRNLQYVKLKLGNKKLLVANLHGFWAPGSNKEDTPERLEQSRIVQKFLKPENLPKILCGDFNLLPHTKSMLTLEDGMTNLIKEYQVVSTRSPHYQKSEKFADYILTSPEIRIEKFSVLDDIVSDHLPLLLEFDL